MAQSKIVSLKILLSNNLTGTLIGLGGKCIKELIEVTQTKVHVSSSTDPYPGTSDRVVVVSGGFDGVLLTLTLIWEMIALVTNSENPKEVEWNPKVLIANLGHNDGLEVTGKLTIPAAAGGLVLGKGGSTIQSMSEESGAHIAMSSKEEAMFTQERIITLSGSVSSCIKCTSFLLHKLNEPAEYISYSNRGTTYTAPVTLGNNPFVNPLGGYPGNVPRPVGPPGQRQPLPGMLPNLRGPPGGPGRGPFMMGPGFHDGNLGGMQGPGPQQDMDGNSVAETTITLSVPNDMIGNIFGKQGATMREIISLSGAKVNVSAKEDYVPGTTNRIVTITGNAASTQTAHVFITQRLQTPANPKRMPRDPHAIINQQVNRNQMKKIQSSQQ